MTRKRLISFAVAALGLAVMIGAGVDMTRRIVAFNEAADRPFFVFQVINAREFGHYGRRVTLTDVEQDGVDYVELDYDGETRRLPVTIPPRFEIATLETHHDWLRALRIVDGTGLTFEEIENRTRSGDLDVRLVIVTKSPRPGADPETWGTVWKKDWTFDFYELKADGSIEEQRLKYPQGRVGTLPGPGELAENTWQYEAALHLMPRGPTGRFRNSALDVVGWTLPAIAISGLAIVLALGFGFAPPRAERMPEGDAKNV